MSNASQYWFGSERSKKAMHFSLLARSPIALYVAIPPLPNPPYQAIFHTITPTKAMIGQEKSRRINHGRNSSDDANGATDIHRSADSGGSARSHSNKTCIVGIRGQRKFENRRLPWIRSVPTQSLPALPSPKGNIFSHLLI